METFKKNAALAQQLEIWLGSHPESEHPYDRDRWYNLIKQSLIKNEPIDFDEVKKYISKNKEWIDEFTEEFIDRKENEYLIITSFFNYFSKEQ